MKNIKSFDLIINNPSSFEMFRIYITKVEFEGEKTSLLKEKFKSNPWFISHYRVNEKQKIVGSEFVTLDSKSQYMMYENIHGLDDCPSSLVHTVDCFHLEKHYNEGVFLNPFEAFEFLNKYSEQELNKIKSLNINYDDGSTVGYFENDNLNIYNKIKEMFINWYQPEKEQVDISKNNYSPIFNPENNERYVAVFNILSILIEENDKLCNHQVVLQDLSDIRIRHKMVNYLKSIKTENDKFVHPINSVIEMINKKFEGFEFHGSDELSCIEYSIIKIPT
jgi:hypothetical protein